MGVLGRTFFVFLPRIAISNYKPFGEERGRGALPRKIVIFRVAFIVVWRIPPFETLPIMIRGEGNTARAGARRGKKPRCQNYMNSSGGKGRSPQCLFPLSHSEGVAGRSGDKFPFFLFLFFSTKRFSSLFCGKTEFRVACSDRPVLGPLWNEGKQMILRSASWGLPPPPSLFSPNGLLTIIEPQKILPK